MKRFLICVSLIGVCTLAPNNVQAGLMGSVISFDGVEDQLQDNSVASLVDNGDGEVNAGDVILGIVRVQKNLTPTPDLDISPTLGELHVVFAAEILTGPAGGTSTAGQNLNYTLGVSTVAGAKLGDLLPSFAPFAAGAIGAVVSSPASSSPTDPTGQTLLAAITNLNSGIWMLDAVIGFDTSFGGFNRHGDTDFFQAQLTDNDGDDKITLASEYTSFTGLSPVGKEAGGFSVLSHSLGSSTVFLEVAASKLFPSPIPAPTDHDVAIRSGQLLKPGSTTPSGFAFADQATFAINAVPEPTSIVLFGIGMLVVGGYSLRRPKKQAA